MRVPQTGQGRESLLDRPSCKGDWYPASSLGEAKTSQAAWRRPTEARKGHSAACWAACCRPCSMFQVSSYGELSPILRWALVIQLSLSHFCSCKKPFTHIPVSSPSKAHWFIERDFGSVLTLVCHEIPVWVSRRVLHLPRKCSVTQRLFKPMKSALQKAM